jgi:DNA-binding SARP family transcriptional activator
MIDLRVLGALEVRATGPKEGQAMPTQPKRLALLLYLALAEPFGLQARDRLLALLWPEADDSSSRHSLRNALHALRQSLGDEAIVTRGESYVGLDAGAIRCDALELRANLAAGRLEEAVSLWSGELAPGFHVSGAPEFEHWLDEQRAQMRRAVRAAAWTRAREMGGAGRAEVDAVRRAVRLDPGDEPGVRSLMHSLVAAGDGAGALRAYQELTDHLARELDAKPSAETRALAADLRSAAVGKSGNAAVIESPRNPTAIPVLPPSGSPAPGLPPRRSKSIARLVVAGGALAVVALAGATYRTSGSPPDPSPETEAQRAVLRLPARYRADTSAYHSYLRGLTLGFKFNFLASKDTFASLVDREPWYVPGLYGLAHAYALAATNDSADADEAWPKVETLARRALALDTAAASAWLALASKDLHRDVDLARARERITRARMLDSLDPDGAEMLSVWFLFHGDVDSAVTEARVASRLDPLSKFFERRYAKHLYFARRYDESRVVYDRMLRDDPRWKRGYEDIAELQIAAGHPRDAVEWYRHAREAAGDSAGAFALPSVSTDSAAVRLLAANARRQIERLERSRRAGEQASPLRYAAAYAVLADTVATMRWLDSLAARRDGAMYHVRVDPIFDFLRNDARYQAWEVRNALRPSP